MDEHAPGSTIVVTAANREEVEAVADELRKEHDYLLSLAERYPVQCEFAGYCITFDTAGELDSLIATLSEKLATFAKTH